MWLRHNRKSIRQGILLLFAFSLTVFYYFVDPANLSFGWPCLLKTTTGWNCWGCGGQRAFHQLLHGHIEEALRLNVLILPFLLISAYIVQAELRGIFNPYAFFRHRYVQIVTLLTVGGFTVLRNLL